MLAVARNDPQILIRLPHEVKDWVKAEAAKNGSSQNSEITRAIRERMIREAAKRKLT